MIYIYMLYIYIYIEREIERQTTYNIIRLHINIGGVRRACFRRADSFDPGVQKIDPGDHR